MEGGKWSREGVVSFDLINLSEIQKHFLWHMKANFMKLLREKKDAFDVIYIV